VSGVRDEEAINDEVLRRIQRDIARHYRYFIKQFAHITIVVDPTPRTPNVYHCELRLVPRFMILLLKERFETARQHSNLQPERIVDNSSLKGVTEGLSVIREQHWSTSG